jgi:hypothetical protein
MGPGGAARAEAALAAAQAAWGRPWPALMAELAHG